MTEKYPELAVADPIFGQLQNCMELAVVGALVVKERLAEKAGYSMPTLLESPAVKPEVFNAPKQVESKASVLKKGRNWVISASGGVAINSWAMADKAQRSDAVDAVRAKAAPADGSQLVVELTRISEHSQFVPGVFGHPVGRPGRAERDLHLHLAHALQVAQHVFHLLDQLRPKRAGRRGHGHDDVDVRLALRLVDADAIDQSEVNDVDHQFRVADLSHGGQYGFFGKHDLQLKAGCVQRTMCCSELPWCVSRTLLATH